MRCLRNEIKLTENTVIVYLWTFTILGKNQNRTFSGFPGKKNVDYQTQAIAIKKIWGTKLTLIRTDFEFTKPLNQQHQCKQSH